MLELLSPAGSPEAVIAAIGYDPERDAENPTGSVFCEHGAGVYVPWNEVKARAHVPCILQERPVEAAEPMPTRSRASSGSAAEDKEVWSRDKLNAILGVKPRRLSPAELQATVRGEIQNEN